MASASSTLVRKEGEKLHSKMRVHIAEILLSDWSTTKTDETNNHVPAMELISVEQQEELVLRVSLPNPCSYTHGFRAEPAGRRLEGKREKGDEPTESYMIACNQALENRLLIHIRIKVRA